MTDVLMATYAYCDSVKQSDNYQQLKNLNTYINSTYAQLIKDFNDAKQHYYDVMATGGSYHPDFKTVAKVLSQTKQRLYEMPEVQKLITLEKTLQDELNTLVREASQSVSNYIKVPNEMGLMKEKESCHASKKNGVHH